MKAEIQKYLDSDPKDYGSGLVLAEKVIANRHLITHFIKQGNTFENREAIAFHLGDAVGIAYSVKEEVKPLKIVRLPQPTAPTVAATTEGSEDISPEEREFRQDSAFAEKYPALKPLLEEKRGLIIARQKLSEQMAASEDPEELKRLGAEIEAKNNRRQEIDSHVNYFIINGKMPEIRENKPAGIVDPELIAKRKATTEARSKVRKRLIKQPANVDLIKEEAQLTAELENIDLQIKIQKEGARANGTPTT